MNIAILQEINLPEHRRASSLLRQAGDSIEEEDYSTALFLLAEGESLLLRSDDPPQNVLRDLGPLRVELAALETDEKR